MDRAYRRCWWPAGRDEDPAQEFELARIDHDLESLAAIPQALWHGPSRWAANALAWQWEVYAYTSAGRHPAIESSWVIWVTPTYAETLAGVDGRIGLATWKRSWRVYYRRYAERPSEIGGGQ